MFAYIQIYNIYACICVCLEFAIYNIVDRVRIRFRSRIFGPELITKEIAEPKKISYQTNVSNRFGRFILHLSLEYKSTLILVTKQYVLFVRYHYAPKV